MTIPTPTPPTVGAIKPYSMGATPIIPNIQPFVYRDQLTYVNWLQGLTQWLTETLIPFLDENFDRLEAAWIAEVQVIIDAVNTALQAQDEEVDQKIAELVEYVDEQVALIIGSSITLQDPVMAGIVTNPTSATRVALDGIYGTVGQIAAINAELTGRLSNATLDGRYQAINTVADPAVASLFDEASATYKIVENSFVVSPAVHGRMRAALNARIMTPAQVVILGSSTFAGSSVPEECGIADRVKNAYQARYPSGYGEETKTIPIANAKNKNPGVHVYQGAANGLDSTDLLASGRLARVQAIQPDIVLIGIGSNDYNSLMAVSTYKANVLARIAEMRAVMLKPTVFILVHNWRRIDTTSPIAPWSAYGNALREIALANPQDTAFIDASVAFEYADFSGTDPYTLRYFDGVHGYPAAHGLLADEIIRIAVPSGTGDPQLNPLVMFDDFPTDGAMPAAPVIGSGSWVYALGAGSFDISGGWAYSNGPGVMFADAGGQFVFCKATVKRPLSGTAGITARAVDENNRIQFYIDQSNNRVILSCLVGGVNNQYAWAPELSAPGTELELMLVTFATSCYGYVNGKLVCSSGTMPAAHVTAVTNGTKCGFRQGSVGLANAAFRNFAVAANSNVNDRLVNPIMPDSQWRKLPLETGYTGSIDYRVKDGRMEILVDVTGTFGTSGYPLSKPLPTKWRPRNLISNVGIQIPSGRSDIFISTNGVVQSQNGTAGTTRLRSSLSYFIG